MSFSDDSDDESAIEILSESSDRSSVGESLSDSDDQTSSSESNDSSLETTAENSSGQGLIDDYSADVDPLDVLEKLRVRIKNLELRSAELLNQNLPQEITLPHYVASLKNKHKRDLEAKQISERLELQLRKTAESDTAGAKALRRKRNLPELGSKALETIQKALHRTQTTEILVKQFNMTITVHDIQKLRPQQWLNDEVINFYGELIVSRNNNEEHDLPSVHFFNTFFYTTLRDRGYNGVKSWGRRAKVFEKDLIIVPVHLGAHWCCGVADIQKKQIVYLDSLLGSNPAFFTLMQTYLQSEHQERVGTELDFAAWSMLEPKDIPQQENGYDCGVFASIFADYTSRREKLEFSQSDMAYFRKKMTFEILQGKLLTI